MNSNLNKILILCPCPLGISPGQRFRFEQYLKALSDHGLVIDVQPFLDIRTFRILYQKGNLVSKIFGVLRGFIRRLFIIPQVYNYNYIFIYREASPIGPPIIETLLFFLRRKIIYDFDDAIFINKTSKVNKIVSLIKWPSKISYIAKHSLKVSVCNNYLLNWTRHHNKNVLLLPTTIDLNYHRPINKFSINNRQVVIGWTGTRSTMVYLDLVRDVLNKLQDKYDFEFRVICDVDPHFPELNNYNFINWSLSTEIEDLSALDIGLMPVPEGEWEQGKVGFKAIQYSGVQAVPVVSATGSGHEVVKHGVTGFVVNNDSESWFLALSILLDNHTLTESMGRAARDYIDTHYSMRSNTQKYIDLFT